MHFHKSFMYFLACKSSSNKCCPSTFFGIARIPPWLFTSQKRGKAVRARGGRERASVSPRPSRLYPACTARWVPHSFRPLESSSRTLPRLPFESWGSKCKDRLGALRARTLFLFLHNRVSFWLCPCVQSSGDLVTWNNLTTRLLSSEGRLGTRLCPAK